MTGSTAASDSAALGEVQPARVGIAELREQRGPRTSSSTMTGTPSRNTEPHQKYSQQDAADQRTDGGARPSSW